MSLPVSRSTGGRDAGGVPADIASYRKVYQQLDDSHHDDVAEHHDDLVAPDAVTRSQLLKLRGYSAEVIAGNGNGNGAPQATCSQCSEPARPGRPTCGSPECVAGHRLARKRASYRDRGRATRRRRNGDKVSPGSVPVPALAGAAPVPPNDGDGVFDSLQSFAERLPDRWTCEIERDSVLIRWVSRPPGSAPWEN